MAHINVLVGGEKMCSVRVANSSIGDSDEGGEGEDRNKLNYSNE